LSRPALRLSLRLLLTGIRTSFAVRRLRCGCPRCSTSRPEGDRLRTGGRDQCLCLPPRAREATVAEWYAVTNQQRRQAVSLVSGSPRSDDADTWSRDGLLRRGVC
jgi:hypothetical protein